MGPWFIRDEANPFLPGCSLQTLRTLIRRGKVSKETVLRGPSTRQFWTLARNAPGIANLLGECHACHSEASPESLACESCGASFSVLEDRERLGLSDVRLLPGHAAPEQIAASSVARTTTESTAQATSNGTAHVGSGTSRLQPPIEFPHDAQALIAASQRRKRQRQQMTLAVVLTCVAIAATAGVVALVVMKRGAGSNGGPAMPVQKNLPPVAPAAQPESNDALDAVEVAPEPLADHFEPHQAEIRDFSALIASLNSSDIRLVTRALAEARNMEPEGSEELHSAIRSAVVRIQSLRLGERL